jgi:beta-galactosidase
MEQQPGPVKWAAWNPAPACGRVRPVDARSARARRRGGELFSLATGVLRARADACRAQPAKFARALSGRQEAAAAANDLARLGDLPASAPAQVAIVYDYEAHWITAIQPQGADFRYSALVFRWYEAIRRLGLDVDSSGHRRGDRDCRFRPARRFENRHFSIPEELPPGPLGSLLNTRVTEVSSLRPGVLVEISGAICGHAERCREQVETHAETLATFADGAPALVAQDNDHYLAFWPDAGAIARFMAVLCEKAGLATIELPTEVRLRRRGSLTFAFNYGQTPWLSATNRCSASRK